MLTNLQKKRNFKYMLHENLFLFYSVALITAIIAIFSVVPSVTPDVGRISHLL